MTNVSKYETGEFCWTDLATPNAAAAKKFYSGIFGWTSKDMPMGEGMTYTIFQAQGKEVCAMYESEETKKGEIPSHWMAYVSVDNADSYVKKAQSAGAKVIEGAMDVADKGRMAVMQDPSGAVFALWQPKSVIGATVQEIPGSVCWRELLTTNEDISGKFYSTVFGWGLKVEKFGPMNYSLLSQGEDNVGGMMKTPMPGMPSVWMTYWIVENCQGTVKKALSLGGKVLKDSTEIPDIGTFAVLQDPQGAAFCVMQGNE